LLAARNIQRYALYMQDYGAPIGFRLIQASPYLQYSPKAEIHILDSGHFATLESPDAVAALVADFASRYDLR
jgi:pimeloyl-ACP methyl ester carboxylesterase